ncbi:MAG: TSUP family transporter [Lachnospiraceae bacterium]|nr:TSUP family transporter [Lachnospiraceae bacterium]
MINIFLQYLSSVGLDIYRFITLGFLVGLAAFVDSIAGGGGLISLPAYMLVGLPPLTSTATNKMTASCGAIMSFGKYAQAGYVKLKVAIPCVIAGFLGSSVSTNIVNYIDQDIFKIMIAVVLPIVLVFVLRKRAFDDSNAVDEIDSKTMTKCIVGSFSIGIYDGLYGPGTGTFLIILFTSVCRLKLTEANGVAKSINLATNIASVIMHLIHGNILIPLALMTGLFSMLGSYLGSGFFKHKGVKIVKPVMVLVLALFIIKIIVEFIQKAG